MTNASGRTTVPVPAIGRQPEVLFGQAQAQQMLDRSISHLTGPDAGLINLYTNPSFETNVVGVAVDANTTKTQDATQFVYGTKSLKWESMAGIAGHHCYFTAQDGSYFSVVPGEWYAMSLWTKPTATTTSTFYHVGMRWLDSMGMLISHSYGSGIGFSTNPPGFLVTPGDPWTYRWFGAQAPAGAATVIPNVEDIASMGVGDGIHIDGVMFSHHWGDPGYVDGAQSDCSWMGTAHASQSRYLRPTSLPSGSGQMSGVF